MFVQWRNIRLVFLREIRDQLRDRRTLFMVFILPLLMYPALGIGMLELRIWFTEQPRTVVMLGEQYLPSPAFLDGDHISDSLFTSTKNAVRLRLITETILDKEKPDAANLKARELLHRGEVLAQEMAERDQARTLLNRAEQAKRTNEIPRLRKQLEFQQSRLAEHFASSDINLLVVIPKDFDKHLERVNRELADRTNSKRDLQDYPRPVLIHNKADEKSSDAYVRVSDAFRNWEDMVLQKRLELAGLPRSLPNPVQPVREDLASVTQIGAMIWSKIFPALLVIMSMIGAFHPAIDLCAGEKERGTMETLLICPAKRVEIVFGKFLTVLCFSVSTAILNLISIGMTGQHIATSIQRTPGSHLAGTPEFPSWFALTWIIILLLPLAAMFSALCLSLATFARSSKEGQYYLTPLLMVTLGLTVFCQSPGVELTPFYSIMPITGVALLLKGLLLNPQDLMLYAYAVPVLITSIGYCLMALWWSVDQFQREEVLFREAERFEIKAWLRQLMRYKGPTPSFTHAGFCFILIMLLQFASFGYLSRAAGDPSQGMNAAQLMKVMLVQQVALVACPALMMGIMLTTSMWQTFRLRLPSIKMVGLALLLAVSAHPLSLMLSVALAWFFPPLPEGVAYLMKGMSDSNQPLAIILITFALAPAFCEEIAFRGFILSGLGRSGRTWLAIIISSLTFGIMHMIPQQVFNAALLGLVLGLIATRSESLWPCIIFHFCFNSLSVLHGRLGHGIGEHVPPNVFFITDSHGEILYMPLTLILAGLAFVTGIRWLCRMTPDGKLLPQPETPSNPFMTLVRAHAK